MDHTYSIKIGDTSGDGHGKSDTYIFNCTHDVAAIRGAYLKAVEKTGLALHYFYSNRHQKGIKVLLEDYEDCYIEKEDFQKLLDLGVDYESADEIEPYDDECSKYCIMPKGVAQLFLQMAKTQLEGFEYEFVEPESVNIPKTGFMGYGCYE